MTSCKDLLEAKKIRDDPLQYNGINFTSHKKWLELPLNRKTLIAEKRQCVIYSQLAHAHAPL